MSHLWKGVREGCGSCAFRLPDEREGHEDSGYCRRYPPQVVVSRPATHYGTTADWEQHFPWMRFDEWCGEWKRKS